MSLPPDLTSALLGPARPIAEVLAEHWPALCRFVGGAPMVRTFAGVVVLGLPNGERVEASLYQRPPVTKQEADWGPRPGHWAVVFDPPLRQQAGPFTAHWTALPLCCPVVAGAS